MSISPIVRRNDRPRPGRFGLWLEAMRQLVERWRLRLVNRVLRWRIRAIEPDLVLSESGRSPDPLSFLHQEARLDQNHPTMYWDEMDEIVWGLRRAGFDPILSISLFQGDEIYTAHLYPEGCGYFEVVSDDDDYDDAEPILKFYFDSVEELRLYFAHLDLTSPAS